jgi:hypothetical protein
MNEQLTGRTYSLYSIDNNTEIYFSLVKKYSSDLCRLYGNDLKKLLDDLRLASRSRKKFSTWINNIKDIDTDTMLKSFSTFIPGLDSHLKSLKALDKYESVLGLKDYQYYTAMIEIDITNRLNISAFMKSEYKLALLPHCLHDLEKDCMAVSDGFENVCRRCSKACYVRKLNDLLNQENIHPYIWRNRTLKSMFKQLYKTYSSVGVLGIACIPELIHGTRRCFAAGIPAVGIPINANLCRRWMGEFYPNSVSLSELEMLIKNSEF